MSGDRNGPEAEGSGGALRARRDGLQRLWGRQKSFALRPRQAALFETLLPRLRVALPADAAPGSLDPRTFFASPPAQASVPPSPTLPRRGGGERDPDLAPSCVSLEIGFGGGEHLIAWAKAHPDEGFIGAEPFLNGMGKMLVHLDEARLSNVRLFAGDARRLVAALADASLARVFLLFPDPWPKKRHWKRRFVQDETLAELARVLGPGGILRIASDIPHYIDWTLEHMGRRPEFIPAHPEGGWRSSPLPSGEVGIRDREFRVRGHGANPPHPAPMAPPSPQGEGPFWPATRYEQKAIRAGRACAYLEFRRVQKQTSAGRARPTTASCSK